jgi:hypothetical protein
VIGLTATSPAIFWRLEDPNSCVLSERSLIQVHPVCTISAVHDAHARNNALTGLSLSLSDTVVDMMTFAAVPSIVLLQLVAFQNLYIILCFM